MRNGPNEVIIQRDGYWLTVGSGERASAINPSELDRIAADLSIADWSDPDTWFDATSS